MITSTQHALSPPARKAYKAPTGDPIFMFMFLFKYEYEAPEKGSSQPDSKLKLAHLVLCDCRYGYEAPEEGDEVLEDPEDAEEEEVCRETRLCFTPACLSVCLLVWTGGIRGWGLKLWEVDMEFEVVEMRLAWHGPRSLPGGEGGARRMEQTAASLLRCVYSPHPEHLEWNCTLFSSQWHCT